MFTEEEIIKFKLEIEKLIEDINKETPNCDLNQRQSLISDEIMHYLNNNKTKRTAGQAEILFEAFINNSKISARQKRNFLAGYITADQLVELFKYAKEKRSEDISDSYSLIQAAVEQHKQAIILNPLVLKTRKAWLLAEYQANLPAILENIFNSINYIKIPPDEAKKHIINNFHNSKLLIERLDVKSVAKVLATLFAKLPQLFDAKVLNGLCEKNHESPLNRTIISKFLSYQLSNLLVPIHDMMLQTLSIPELKGQTLTAFISINKLQLSTEVTTQINYEDFYTVLNTLWTAKHQRFESLWQAYYIKGQEDEIFARNVQAPESNLPGYIVMAALKANDPAFAKALYAAAADEQRQDIIRYVLRLFYHCNLLELVDDPLLANNFVELFRQVAIKLNKQDKLTSEINFLVKVIGHAFKSQQPDLALRFYQQIPDGKLKTVLFSSSETKIYQALPKAYILHLLSLLKVKSQADILTFLGSKFDTLITTLLEGENSQHNSILVTYIKNILKHIHLFNENIQKQLIKTLWTDYLVREENLSKAGTVLENLPHDAQKLIFAQTSREKALAIFNEISSDTVNATEFFANITPNQRDHILVNFGDNNDKIQLLNNFYHYCQQHNLVKTNLAEILCAFKNIYIRSDKSLAWEAIIPLALKQQLFSCDNSFSNEERTEILAGLFNNVQSAAAQNLLASLSRRQLQGLYLINKDCFLGYTDFIDIKALKNLIADNKTALYQSLSQEKQQELLKLFILSSENTVAIFLLTSIEDLEKQAIIINGALNLISTPENDKNATNKAIVFIKRYFNQFTQPEAQAAQIAALCAHANNDEATFVLPLLAQTLPGFKDRKDTEKFKSIVNSLANQQNINEFLMEKIITEAMSRSNNNIEYVKNFFTWVNNQPVAYTAVAKFFNTLPDAIDKLHQDEKTKKYLKNFLIQVIDPNATNIWRRLAIKTKLAMLEYTDKNCLNTLLVAIGEVEAYKLIISNQFSLESASRLYQALTLKYQTKFMQQLLQEFDVITEEMIVEINQPDGVVAHISSKAQLLTLLISEQHINAAIVNQLFSYANNDEVQDNISKIIWFLSKNDDRKFINFLRPLRLDIALTLYYMQHEYLTVAHLPDLKELGYFKSLSWLLSNNTFELQKNIILIFDDAMLNAFLKKICDGKNIAECRNYIASLIDMFIPVTDTTEYDTDEFKVAHKIFDYLLEHKAAYIWACFEKLDALPPLTEENRVTGETKKTLHFIKSLPTCIHTKLWCEYDGRYNILSNLGSEDKFITYIIYTSTKLAVKLYACLTVPQKVNILVRLFAHELNIHEHKVAQEEKQTSVDSAEVSKPVTTITVTMGKKLSAFSIELLAMKGMSAQLITALFSKENRPIKATTVALLFAKNDFELFKKLICNLDIRVALEIAKMAKAKPLLTTNELKQINAALIEANTRPTIRITNLANLRMIQDAQLDPDAVFHINELSDTTTDPDMELLKDIKPPTNKIRSVLDYVSTIFYNRSLSKRYAFLPENDSQANSQEEKNMELVEDSDNTENDLSDNSQKNSLTS